MLGETTCRTCVLSLLVWLHACRISSDQGARRPFQCERTHLHLISSARNGPVFALEQTLKCLHAACSPLAASPAHDGSPGTHAPGVCPACFAVAAGSLGYDGAGSAFCRGHARRRIAASGRGTATAGRQRCRCWPVWPSWSAALCSWRAGCRDPGRLAVSASHGYSIESGHRSSWWLGLSGASSSRAGPPASRCRTVRLCSRSAAPASASSQHHASTTRAELLDPSWGGLHRRGLGRRWQRHLLHQPGRLLPPVLGHTWLRRLDVPCGGCAWQGTPRETAMQGHTCSAVALLAWAVN